MAGPIKKALLTLGIAALPLTGMNAQSNTGSNAGGKDQPTQMIKTPYEWLKHWKYENLEAKSKGDKTRAKFTDEKATEIEDSGVLSRDQILKAASEVRARYLEEIVKEKKQMAAIDAAEQGGDGQGAAAQGQGGALISGDDADIAGADPAVKSLIDAARDLKDYGYTYKPDENWQFDTNIFGPFKNQEPKLAADIMALYRKNGGKVSMVDWLAYHGTDGHISNKEVNGLGNAKFQSSNPQGPQTATARPTPPRVPAPIVGYEAENAETIKMGKLKHQNGKKSNILVKEGIDVTLKDMFLDYQKIHAEVPKGGEIKIWGQDGHFLLEVQNAAGQSVSTIQLSNVKISDEQRQKQTQIYKDLNLTDGARAGIGEIAEVLRGNKTLEFALINAGEKIAKVFAGMLGNMNQWETEFENAPKAQAEDLVLALRVMGFRGLPQMSYGGQLGRGHGSIDADKLQNTPGGDTYQGLMDGVPVDSKTYYANADNFFMPEELSGDGPEAEKEKTQAEKMRETIAAKKAEKTKWRDYVSDVSNGRGHTPGGKFG